MVTAASNHLYDRVVDVTREYLGPAADRFISRQITNHLRKDPEALVAADMRRLIDWLKLSMAFLTNDERLIARYVDELKAATRPPASRLTTGTASRTASPATAKLRRSAAHGKDKARRR